MLYVQTIACTNERLHYTKYVLLNYWWRKVFETCGTDIQYRRYNKRSHAYESIFCELKCNSIFLSVYSTCADGIDVNARYIERKLECQPIHLTEKWWTTSEIESRRNVNDHEIRLEEFIRTVRCINIGFLISWKPTYSKVF